MPRKGRSSIIKNQDVAAATFVVGDDLEVADFRTIQEAIDNLPSVGGSIALLQGTFSLSAAIVLPDAPVFIFGSGRDAVDISIGSNAINMFETAFDQPYRLEGFTALAGGLVGQNFFRQTASPSSLISLYLKNLKFGIAAGNSFEKPLSMVSGAAAPGGVVIEDVTMVLRVGAGSLLADGATLIHARNVFQSGSGGTGTTVELEAIDCELDVTNTLNNSNATMTGCRFRGTGKVKDGGDKLALLGCAFSDASFLQLENSDHRVEGCVWDGAGITRCIDIIPGGSQGTISGCVFGGFSSEAIRTVQTSWMIEGNVNCHVLESGAADNNHYSNNEGFDGSTIIGPDSVVDDWNVRTVTTTPVTLDRDDRTVDVDASGGNRLVNLPTAASARYHTYKVRKLDASANTVTVDPAGAETINGASTFVLSNQFDAIIFQSNGTTWIILARFLSSAGRAFVILNWEVDDDTDPSVVQLTKVETVEIPDGNVKGVIESIETPRDISLLANPTVRVQIAVTAAGSGTGNVVMRLTVRYIAVTELASKAADETLSLTAPVATNTVQAIQADIIFTLDASLIADSDEINFALERVGTDGSDTFDGDIGIITTSRMDYSKA